jgi:hypothetical protein
VRDVVEAFSWAADSIRRMVQYFEGTAAGRQQLAAAAAGAMQAPSAAAGEAATAGGGGSGGVNFSGLSKEQQWAMVQAEGQSQSLQLEQQQQQQEELAQQQQQGQAELQQQLLQGYLFLGKLIDVYGALGRGSAAEAHRQQLAAAAAAARRSKAEQQQGQKNALQPGQTQLHIVNGQLHGVKLTRKKAKKLKIAGLDKPLAAAGASAGAAASSAPAAAAAAGGFDASRLLTDPELLAAVHNGIASKRQRMRPQRALQLYGGALRAVAAAEDALSKTDLAGAAAAARTARECLAASAVDVLANVDNRTCHDLAGLMEVHEVRCCIYILYILFEKQS